MSKNRVFVIGYIGSDRWGRAETISSYENCLHVDIDQMIESKLQMSIKQLCSSRGEHEYRNMEFKALELLVNEENIVVSCGDGIILDERCRKLLRKEEVIFVNDMIENLWGKAKSDPKIPYAFLTHNSDSANFEKFCELFAAREALYIQCTKRIREVGV